MNALHLAVAATSGLLSERLMLQRVDAADPTNALLIETHCRRILGIGGVERFDLGKFAPQFDCDIGDTCCVGHR